MKKRFSKLDNVSTEILIRIRQYNEQTKSPIYGLLHVDCPYKLLLPYVDYGLEYINSHLPDTISAVRRNDLEIFLDNGISYSIFPLKESIAQRYWELHDSSAPIELRWLLSPEGSPMPPLDKLVLPNK